MKQMAWAVLAVPRFAFSMLTLPMILARLLPSRIALAPVVALFVLLQYLWVLNIWSGKIGIAP